MVFFSSPMNRSSSRLVLPRALLVVVGLAAALTPLLSTTPASAASPGFTADSGPGGTPFKLAATDATDTTNRDDGLSTLLLPDGRRLWVLGDTFENSGPQQSKTHSST